MLCKGWIYKNGRKQTTTGKTHVRSTNPHKTEVPQVPHEHGAESRFTKDSYLSSTDVQSYVEARAPWFGAAWHIRKAAHTFWLKLALISELIQRPRSIAITDPR